MRERSRTTTDSGYPKRSATSTVQIAMVSTALHDHMSKMIEETRLSVSAVVLTWAQVRK